MRQIDKLYQAVVDRGHVCVGLDTDIKYVPTNTGIAPADAITYYNKALVDATLDVAACYKVQIACYEALGLSGLRAYAETLEYIRKNGGLVIADIKRGDIGNTAEYYAKGHFEGDFKADFVTLSPYMGMDSIIPWAKVAAEQSKGAFVLLRTTNEGRKDFQDQKLQSDAPLYTVVGEKLSQLAEQYMGENGYGMFGAVVGCTDSKEATEVRTKYPNLFFLIPGYGAQGGAADDAAKLLRDGNGGVVNASRSILTAWQKAAEKDGIPKDTIKNAWASEMARKEAISMRDAIRAACATR